MSKNKKEKKIDKEENDDITINLKESSITEFTKRELPTEEEVKRFEEVISSESDVEVSTDEQLTTPEIHDEAYEEEIAESLNEIYHDDKGELVDVKKFKILKKRGFFFFLFVFTFVVASLSGAAYFAYINFFAGEGSDATAVNFTVEGKYSVVSGEEFFYTLNYKNSSGVTMTRPRIEINYPDNYLFIEGEPAASKKNIIWDLEDIAPNATGQIKIRGKMIGPEDSSGILMASLAYTPENFSSEFKKNTTITTTVDDVGMKFAFDFSNNILVDEDNELLLGISSKEKNYTNNMRVTISAGDNVSIVEDGDSTAPEEEIIKNKAVRPGVWVIDEILEEEKILPIIFKYTNKEEDQEKISIIFETLSDSSGDDDSEKIEERYVEFFRKDLEFEVVKSDLNLTLIANGSREDQAVNFGDTMNYSLVYKNKGESEMKDVVIMAVLESDFLDWTTLTDEFAGTQKGNAIIWTKEELPDLELVEQDQEGVIDFSIKLMDVGNTDTTSDYDVKSYAQFNIGKSEDDLEDTEANENNKSNTIVSKINSDIKLDEQIRYFSEDNVPVGTGPHPPKAGEETSYKVYWKLTNSLHELKDLKIVSRLPDYVSWAGKVNVSVGEISFDDDKHEIEWNIGRLPITVFETEAEFSISIKPEEDNRNKIMVIMTGSKVTATDRETDFDIELKTKAKTTKLEDDDIASGDGIVE